MAYITLNIFQGNAVVECGRDERRSHRVGAVSEFEWSHIGDAMQAVNRISERLAHQREWNHITRVSQIISISFRSRSGLVQSTFYARTICAFARV